MSTILSFQLTLGNDDLNRWDVLGVGERVVQDADASDDLLDQLHSVLESTLDGVGRVANDHGAVGNPVSILDTDDLPVFEEDLVDVGVQHESASVDGADPRESFRDASKTVDGINEWRVSILAHGIGVELDLPDHLDSRELVEALIGVEGNCVADEVNGVGLESEFLEHDLGRLARVDS